MDLCDGVVKQICGLLYDPLSPSSSYDLISLAATCKQWRLVAGDLRDAGDLVLDTLENAHTTSPAAQRFKRQPQQVKAACFLGAIKAFWGEQRARPRRGSGAAGAAAAPRAPHAAADAAIRADAGRPARCG
jgi:hypothetical protein